MIWLHFYFLTNIMSITKYSEYEHNELSEDLEKYDIWKLNNYSFGNRLKLPFDCPKIT